MIMKTDKSARGFTLIEIMIAIAILALLAAITIPNLMTARSSANEGAIKRDLRTFGTAAEAYRSAQPAPTYPASIANMVATTPAYLDSSWGQGGVKHGFTVNYSAYPSGTYTLLAVPTANAGKNSYCLDNTGVIKGGITGVSANASGCSGGTPIS
jgi:prepilin-type N-terminal cleavage/methylation domain-containing protein